MNKESKHGVAMNKPLTGKKINLSPLLLYIPLLLFYSNVYGFSPGKIHTTEELVQEADRILLVQYLEGIPQKRGYRIVTLHKFKVLDVIKGSHSDTFEYYQAGGVLDGVDERIEGMPTYNTGEECLLFMKNPKTPEGLTAPIGSMQGKFRVSVDEKGVPQAENPILDHIQQVRAKSAGAAAVPAPGAVPQKSLNTKRSLHELKGMVRP